MKFIYYFGSSQTGGGLTRLRAYAEHLPLLAPTDHHEFVVHQRHADLFKPTANLSIVPVSPSSLQRLCSDNFYFSDKSLPTDAVVFAYGAAVLPKGGRLVLHISNALPFAAAEVAMESMLRMKMLLLKKRLKGSAALATRITVESAATRALVHAAWGDACVAKCVVLENGVDVPSAGGGQPEPFPYAVTFGTHLYKRPAVVLTLFEALRQVQPDLRLLVVDTHAAAGMKVDGSIVQVRSGLDQAEAYRLIAHASVFLSASQIENSSVAMLEAIASRRRIVCSDIPSHRELLLKHGYRLQPCFGDCVDASPSAPGEPVAGWRQVAAKTLAILRSA